MNRTHPLRLLTAAATGLAALVAAASPLRGALIMYEGFNYGATDVALNTISGSATGLTGSYSGAGGYVSTGMTFGNLETSGGRAALNAPASNQTARRQLNTGTLSGTIYGSFLFERTSSLSSTDFLAVGFGPSNATDNTATALVLPDRYTTSGLDTGAVRANPNNTGSPPYSANGTVVMPDVTPVLLGLYEITNVGATSGTQTMTFWILNEAQFLNFRLDGLTTAELNSASIGTGAANVYERIALPINGTNGYIDLNNTDYLTFIYRSGDYNLDEIRISNASLNEVAPIPEPGSAVLLGLAGMVILIGGRRSRKI